MRVEGTNKIVHGLKGDFSQINQIILSHSVSIKKLETQIGQISSQLNVRQQGDLPSDTVANPMNDDRIMDIITRSGKNLSENVVTIKKKTLDETNVTRK